MKAFKDLLGSRKSKKSSSKARGSSAPATLGPNPTILLEVSTPSRSSPLPGKHSPTPSAIQTDLQLRIQVLEKENARLRQEAAVRDDDLKKLQKSYTTLLRSKAPVPKIRKQV